VRIIPFKGRIFGSEPRRGDVVVFKLPRDNSTDCIECVIGLPGDHIEVRDGIVYVNGQAAAQTSAGEHAGPEEARPKQRYEETLPNGGKRYVPAGQYFMLGNNRDGSLDSRVPAWQRGAWDTCRRRT
jgi:signal peptidase I